MARRCAAEGTDAVTLHLLISHLVAACLGAFLGGVIVAARMLWAPGWREWEDRSELLEHGQIRRETRVPRPAAPQPYGPSA